MSNARETIADILPAWTRGVALHRADTILSALSAMPLASRVALARALVPEMAVVPREATPKMLEAGEDTFVSGYTGTPSSTPEDVWTAMLTAAEKEPGHGS